MNSTSGTRIYTLLDILTIFTHTVISKFCKSFPSCKYGLTCWFEGILCRMNLPRLFRTRHRNDTLFFILEGLILVHDPTIFLLTQPYSSPMVIILCACSSPGKHIKKSELSIIRF